MPRTLAQHVFRRLQQLNCHTIHGVPGDFFLRTLDHVTTSRSKWIGNANELCAGYAADGYARTVSQLARHRSKDMDPSPMIGAFMTTYGVGELSAINAVAGSQAESVPVVQLVGTPSSKPMRQQDPSRLVHHTIPGRGMDVYSEMVDHVVCKQAHLRLAKNANDAAEMYDDALQTAIQRSKPVYVTLASDMVDLPVSTELLDDPIQVSRKTLDAGLVQDIIKRLAQAARPLIIADALSYPFGLQAGVNELVRLTNIPAMSYTSGKGIIDELLPSWSPDMPNTTEYSRNCDMVLVFGPLPSDTNTSRWSAIPQTENVISFNLDSVELSTMEGRSMVESSGREALAQLVATLRSDIELLKRVRNEAVENNKTIPQKRQPPSPAQSTTQDDFWPTMSTYLKPEDTLLFANGTPLIGGRALQLPESCQVVASPIWNAIGSMLPTAQGIAAAKRDHQLPGRTILFEGDGSFQVTCQSLSDIIRYHLDVTIFIVNNAGYTYERYLNGMQAEYNDVPAWRYVDAASFFGAKSNDPSYPVFTKRLETWGELLEVFADEKANDGKGLKIFDVVMDPQDVPEAAKAGLRRASEALKQMRGR
ncbi:uncharacterized protein LTR77_007578 [Saxophila tyrrhenica]|uniref:Pyruvate decarboxylase n=1 Tax=Saxophila tyrrhenica TaxID=1690608 RepID=A0AAV9P2G2_9PEZI|nr:hypothetical protein LTR77_007578 [Saxophila tyrrhenica]